jgi:UDP-GlcNAc:undecaprenyl-phosphate GlcNAc-1-phosphate transferase
MILAAVVTVVLIPLLERYAEALHVIDGPGPRKVHERPVPRVGGIAMFAGALVPLLLWLPLDRLSLAYLAGAAIIFSFGFWDDRRNLSPGAKLLGQLAGVTVVVVLGGVTIDSISLTSRIEFSDWLAVPLTIAFLLGVTNAINLTDGLDGLAGGTSFLCLAAMVALALGHDVPNIMLVCVIIMSSVLGFLRYNSFPARVFMGDGGSQWLGFTLGVLAISVSQQHDLPYSAALPLLLLGLPIMDMLGVIVIRLRERRSPFSADRRHLHHRLLAIGFDHFEAVALIYLLQGALLVLAWFMRYESDLWILLAFGVVSCAVLGGVYGLNSSGWQWQGIGGVRLAGTLQRRVPWLKAPAHLPRWGNAVAWLLVSAYCLLVAARSTVALMDVAWLALGLALALAMAAARMGKFQFIEQAAHAAVFVAISVAVYLDHLETDNVAWVVWTKGFIFLMLAVTVLVRLRFWRERRFEVTTLDVLVIFIALVLPNLPGLRAAPGNVGLSLVKLVVLLYAVEMLTSHSARVRRWLWASTAAAMGVVAVSGLL